MVQPPLSADSPTPDPLRNIIYKALNEFLSPSELALALRIWNEKYQGEQLNGLIGLIKDLAQPLALDQHQQHCLRMKLYHQFRLMHESQGGFSQTESPAPPRQKVSSEIELGAGIGYRLLQERTDRLPALAVFTEICCTILAAVKQTGPQSSKSFIQRLRIHLQNSTLDASLCRQILAWSNGQRNTASVDFEQAELSQGLRLLYRALREAFGAVAADAALKDAVHRAQQLPEARHFPPRQLLKSAGQRA